MNNIFITGMARSGTTLIEKLLCNHKDLSVISQPFPFLFIQAKKEFYDSITYKENYFLLNHYFKENKYRISELNQFLKKLSFNRKDLQQIFLKMEDYSGQYTKDINIQELINKIDCHNFLHLVKSLQYQLKHKANARFYGSKEVHCEEFVPFFIKNGVKSIIIIRDPRAVIASINHGKGKKFTGQKRPLLVNIRNWRKSIAFSIFCEGDPNFLTIKYEDLVLTPFQTLKLITNFLNIPEFQKKTFKEGIMDQSGDVWSGNSSFSKIDFLSKKSIDKYKEILSEKVIKYIEFTCFLEMKYFNYDFHYQNPIDFSFMRQFKEPYKIKRKEFHPNYSSLQENIEDEIKRIELLSKNCDNEKIISYFIFKKVYELYKQLLKK